MKWFLQLFQDEGQEEKDRGPYREPAEVQPVVFNDCIDIEGCSYCKWLERGCCKAKPGDLPELRE